LLVDNSFIGRDVVFDQVDERAYVRKVIPAAKTPRAENIGFISIIFINEVKESL
jgi:hypothetical protein